MDQHNQTFKERLDAIRLTPEEKAAMRLRLYATMHDAPAAPQARPVQSPYTFFFSMQRFMGAVAALLIVAIIGGTGTAYAAQGALPGDLLYTVKVRVNEQVETALARTPAQKAQVHVELAGRRLEEAQALAMQGRLTTTTSAEISSNFDAHATAAQALSQQLAQADPGEAVQIATQLSSTVAANDAVLASIGVNAKDEETRKNSETIGAHVRAIAMGSDAEDASPAGAATLAVSAARTQEPEAPKGKGLAARTLSAPAEGEKGASASGEASVTTMLAPVPAQSAGSQEIAAKLETRATEQLAADRAQYASLKAALDASTAAQFDERFSAADTLMSQGSAALGAGEYGSAVSSFKGALRAAVLLNAYLRAGKNLAPSILNQLLGGQVEGAATSSASSSTSATPPPDKGSGSDDTVRTPEVKGIPTSEDLQDETHVEVSVPPVHIPAPEIHL